MTGQSTQTVALNVMCSFEYAFTPDWFFHLSCGRGQCTHHAFVKEQGVGGISARHRGEQVSEEETG